MHTLLLLSSLAVTSAYDNGYFKELLSDSLQRSLSSATSSCALKQTKEACTEECLWCQLGSTGGMCLDPDNGNKVNDAHVPHLKCGGDPDIADELFWEDFITCLVPPSATDCSETPTRSGKGCSWCDVHASEANLSYDVDLTGTPRFGICLSNEFIGEMESNVEQSGNVQALKEAMTCSNNDPDDVPGLLDFKCAMMTAIGIPEMCKKFTDKSGNYCAWTNVFDYTDVCLSQAQSGVLKVLQGILTSFGIDTASFVSQTDGVQA